MPPLIFPFSPKFVYGSGPTTLSMLHTTGIWTPDRELVGGKSESGAGVPETYILRKEGLLGFNLRVDQSEWLNFLTMIEWIVEAGSLGVFDFYIDQLSATHKTCYLIKPTAGQLVTPQRTQLVTVFEVAMTIKTVDKSPFNFLVA